MTALLVARRLSGWYFAIPLAIIFAHALAADSVYRFLAYGNILLLAVILIADCKHRDRSPTEMPFRALLLPLLLVALHIVTTGQAALIKEMRHIFVAAFLAIGIQLYASHINTDPRWRQRALIAAGALLVAYTAIQLVARFGLRMPYGTTKNPHYLAQYSALLIVVGLYLMHLVAKPWRWLLAVCLPLLGYLLLTTSSRPAWLALMAGALVFAALRLRSHYLSIAAMFGLVGVLYATDTGGFSSRLTELLSKLSTEERVYIWQDAWRLQMSSSPMQWLLGHGLGTFKNDFLEYSTYHGLVDFNAPHNFVLELLYTVGAAGTLAILAIIAGIYLHLFRAYRTYNGSPYVLTLILVLTINLLFTSITLPFFTSYNLLILGIVGGLALSLTTARRRSSQ